MPKASTLTLATAILAGSIISASAADMPVAPPPPPPYDWTGWYIGFGIGAANHEVDWAFANLTTTFNNSWDTTRVQLHAGSQYMFGMGWGGIVLGVDLAAAFPLEDRIGAAACPNVAFLCESRFNALYTVGGKLGVAFAPFLGFGGGFMIYGTGGLALGDFNTRLRRVATDALLSTDGDLQDGWYVGAGLDWAAYKGNGIDLILGFEYKHIEFDATRNGLLFGLVDVGFTRDVTLTTDQFMAKASFKFGGPRWW
jgi:opacity protein-like surface antigen